MIRLMKMIGVLAVDAGGSEAVAGGVAGVVLGCPRR